MLIFTLRRLNLFILTMLLLTTLSFSLSFLFPGDQIINISGQVNATPEQMEIISLSYAKNESVIFQYWIYLKHIFDGDFGLSMANQLPINNEIMTQLPATIELSLVALLIAMFIGIPIGFLRQLNIASYQII